MTTNSDRPLGDYWPSAPPSNKIRRSFIGSVVTAIFLGAIIWEMAEITGNGLELRVLGLHARNWAIYALKYSRWKVRRWIVSKRL